VLAAITASDWENDGSAEELRCSMMAKENKSRWVISGALAMMFSLCGYLNAKSAGVRGNIQDLSQPTEALVFLQQLPDASCVDLFTGKVEDQSEVAEKAKACQGPVTRVETKESYDFSGLKPGWYLLRFQWVMSQPPDSKRPVGCSIQGWTISYVPSKESGKYKGFAQSPPFELHEGEIKTLDFNYDGEFKIQKDCGSPVKWQKK
jgi:hypothetical protein